MLRCGCLLQEEDQEQVPFICATLQTVGDPMCIGCFGLSSGFSITIVHPFLVAFPTLGVRLRHFWTYEGAATSYSFADFFRILSSVPSSFK